MDSLKGAKLVKADGTTVEADSALADKVKHTYANKILPLL